LVVPTGGLYIHKEKRMAQLESLADAPGTLREYETIYILRSDTVNDRVAELNQRVKAIIEERGGKVIKVDNWGKRRLAYEVKKQLKGIYLYWQYLGSPDIVAEFERNMRMLDPVVRYMTVKIDSDVDPTARPTEVDDESYERAANTAADEEELMMRRSVDHDLGAEPAGEAGEAAPAAESTDDEAEETTTEADDSKGEE
jgi:small subunit ribosomal protein S6